MIICHERKLIFIKSKKVAGTSMEIALSKFCGADCVITRISPIDEATRIALGHRGAQNYHVRGLNRLLTRRWSGKLGNHITASKVHAIFGPSIWQNYCKFTIVRNPFDRAVSRFYWDQHRGLTKGHTFSSYFQRYPLLLPENVRIAPLSGPDAPNIFLRYEYMQQDLTESGLEFIWPYFSVLSAKSGHQPARGLNSAQLFQAYPEVAKLIVQQCAAEITRFGYVQPD